MTCDEARILVHALADGELDAGHARDVEVHVAQCAACAAALAAAREAAKYPETKKWADATVKASGGK
jgi:anti-sigma factor RsiW